MRPSADSSEGNVIKLKTFGAVLLLAALAALAACSSAVGPGAPTNPAQRPVTAQPDPGNGGNVTGVPGGWQGTITIRAVMDDSSDETSTSGEGVYATTTRDQSETHLDTSDTFTLTGHDPEDRDFGVSEIDLTGHADNNGTTLDRTTITSDSHNALGCHYTDEVGTEINAPWSQSGVGNVTIRFNDDGTYYIASMSAGGDPVTGEYESVSLPKRLWETYTILEGAARDCPPAGTSELQDTGGPVISWASGQADDNELKGSVNPSNPGSVLDGSVSYETTLPDATVTASWHLVHEGPMLLPNDGPAEDPY